MTDTKTFLPAFLRRGPILSSIALLAGCATATIEDTAPVTSVAPVVTAPRSESVAAVAPSGPVASVPAMTTSALGRPRNTGTFPNLNIPPRVAAPAFTPVEKQTSTAALRASQAAQGTQAVEQAAAAADNAMLRRLAKTHGADTLSAIEKPAPSAPVVAPAAAAPVPVAVVPATVAPATPAAAAVVPTPN